MHASEKKIFTFVNGGYSPEKECAMKIIALLVALVGLMLSDSAFAIGCPYVLKVDNKLPGAVNLVELKTRISGLTWKVEDTFKDDQMINKATNWSDEYHTDSLCNTTKHDFQLKFKNAQNNVVVKTVEKIKVNNGETITFTLGK
jgi:hypothetical protein